MLLAAFLACSPADTTDMNLAFDDAEAEFGVPRDLLVSLAWTQTRLDGRGGELSTEGGVGVMNLRVDGQEPSVDRAAELLGVEVDDVVNDTRLNILGGAAVLNEMARQRAELIGDPIDTYEEWYPVAVRYAGASEPLVGEGFAAQAFEQIHWGLIAETPSGEVVEVPAHDFPWMSDRMAMGGSSLIDGFVPASTSNYTNSSRGSVTMVVIHTMQGSYSGSISWFQNPSASASAHYMVRSSDGEITQMVDEADIAWHAGHWSTNEKSIGIEHEGYIDSPDKWYTDAMYASSAALVRDICDRYGIPMDRSHIIGHTEVPGCSGSGGGSGCHTDPGTGWDWTRFMGLVTSGSTGAGASTPSGGGPSGGSSSGGSSSGGSSSGGSSSGGSSSGGSSSSSPLVKDGAKSGSFEATVSVSRFGATATCKGPVSGSASSGHIYLNGTCHLEAKGRSGDFPVSWSGEVSGATLSGMMVVDGYSASYSGKALTDGSTDAAFSGSKDIGGDVGTVTYSGWVRTNP